MNRPTSTRDRPAALVCLLLFAGLLLCGMPASAQDIKVTSAVPDMADQGTVGLVVTIGGENFGKGSKVDFFVTGTTNPGGIAVKSVKYKNPKTLEATVDVAPDAQTELKFDIQVMSNGRTGKGTELFSVIKKIAGDTTPPGAVTTFSPANLQAVQIGYNTAVLTWIAPADDGYDPSTGNAVKYDIRVRKGSSQETPYCGPYTLDIWVDDSMTGIWSDPCHVHWARPNAGPTGSQATNFVLNLAPFTTYWAVVRAVDDSPQGPNWSDLPAPPYQLSFTTGPHPGTPWNATIVDAAPVTEYVPISSARFYFDDAGNPAMLYAKHYKATFASWTDLGGWQPETVGAEIDTGNYAYDIAFDPVTKQPAIANVVRVIGPVNGSKNELRFYLRLGATSEPWQADVVATGDIGMGALLFNPVSSDPTLLYSQNVKTNSTVVRVAQRHGASWAIQDVATGSTGPARLAFDTAGNPAVSFVKSVNGVAALAFALRQGGSWKVEQPESPPGSPWTAMNDTAVAFDSSDPYPNGDFAVAGLYRDAANTGTRLLRYCRRESGTWTCDTVAQGLTYCRQIALTFGSDGTAYLAYREYNTLFVAIRRSGESTWTHEYARWDAVTDSWIDQLIGPDGQPAIAYTSVHDATGAGGRAISIKFTRRTSQ